MSKTQITLASLDGEAVNESKIQISNAGSDGNFLQKQSGNTGGLTWASASADADDYFATSGLSSKDLGSGLHLKVSDTSGSVNANSDNLVLEENGNVGLTMLSANNGTGHIYFGNGADEDEGFITYDSDNNRMRFGVNAAERMRIDGTGNVGIGITTIGGSFSNGYGIQLHASGYSQFNADNEIAGAFGRSNDGTAIALVRGTSTVGTISVSSSSTAYNTSSDYRLKENETSITDGIERLKQLKPYRFNFKADADKTVDGFFAHEVSSIVPEAITGEKDGTDMQGIDQSKLVPLLTSALQEAITKIETLETEMTALKARVTTLEE